jgi:MFS transporter, DHA1 family, inner membrane transport protein
MKYERVLILLLAAVQFTHILDFVIMMPLGPQLMRAFEIDARSFGMLVSSYTFSSAIFGFMGAFFIDHYDRKKALLFVYTGFLVGTFFCAIAPSNFTLLSARIFAGAFGGIVNTLVFTIIGDQIPEKRRGEATGIVMASFSVASVLGVPLGLFFADRFNWHAPFFGIVAVGGMIWFLLFSKVANMREHLIVSDVQSKRVKIKSEFIKLQQVVLDSNHQRAFALTMCLMFAAFSLIPFLSPYVVHNVGLPEAKLPLVYLCGGALTFFSSRYFGVLSDRHGKFRVFSLIALASLFPIFVVTHIGQASVPVLLLITTVFMVLISGRFVPAMALITSSAAAGKRGSFMSINNALQHLSSGTAALVAGFMIHSQADGALEGYNNVGYMALSATVLSIFLAKRIRIR